MRRIVRRAVYVKAALASLTLVLCGAGYLRLVAGPVSLQPYAARVEEALASRIGPGWTVRLNGTAIELQGARPAVRTAGLEIRNPAGLAVVRAPYAVVNLDLISLLTGSVAPREVELRDLQLKGMIAADGSISFEPQALEARPAATAELRAALPAAPPPDRAAQAVPSPVSAAILSLLGPIVQSESVLGTLDRATVTGARLTLVGPDGRERAAFHRVAASFVRLPEGGRGISLDLDGQGGAWSVRGRVGQSSELGAELDFAGVPVGDVLLLTGMSRLPAGSDLRLSGRVSTSFAGDRLTRLEGRFQSSAGSITRPDRAPILLDQVSGEASWNEAARSLRLGALDVRSQGTTFGLAGDAAAIGPDWRIRLAGRDAVVAGLAERDQPFTIGSVEIEAAFSDGSFRLERAALKGDALDIEFSGSRVAGPSGPSIRGLVEARRTNARRLVRLWPDAFNPELRSYLAGRLGAGTVERLRLRSVLDGPDIEAAFSTAPLSDGALDLDFAASGAELTPVDGMPPLRGLTIEGKVSGTKASLQTSAGRIDMPDGRSLAFANGRFVHANTAVPNSAAQISFRIAGGMDALASLVRSPIFREAGAPEVDPSTLRGRADLRVSLPLVPGRIPPLSDLALSVSGNLSDVHADKLPGREKLEGGTFTVGYEAGALSVRGDGKLGGSPATFDLLCARGGPAELSVALTLDDAARARRSLPAAPVLTGPVPVKVVANLAAEGRMSPRFDIDLSRAAIDGLVPGWVKPSNKPGRVTFVLQDGDVPELRDVVVDAGTVQIKGSLVLGAAGGIDRVDLGTFKLSPGDDLKVQAERGGGGSYRVVLRGNNADARPLLRWATATTKAGGREPVDVDLDVALNILTGFNDEAMTGVSAKLTSRGSDLRTLQFAGRFRNAIVDAQLGKRDAGAPVLNIRSGDAGATLRFVDLYRRMSGGKLTVEARQGAGQQEGRLTVDDFGLRGEPALTRIVTQASQQQQQQAPGEDRGMAPIARSDVDQVLFNKLSADFRRSASRVDFSEVVIYGTQVGFNLSGSVDFGRDRLDVGGTFVPLYMFNNAFSQLPVIGILLGGGRNEGLFAVDFRVAGPIASPTLTVNPLTAVAPGILRKLFGWMMPEGGEAPPSTASAPRRGER